MCLSILSLMEREFVIHISHNMPVYPRKVSTFSESGGTKLRGDVTISEGTNITITQSGNDLSIASSGTGGADTALSNLASVQINTNLVFPDVADATEWYVKVDNQAGSNFDGNALGLLGGNGNGSGSGSQVGLFGGVGGTTGAGGNIVLLGGVGGATSGAGGTINISGGSATAGNSNGGDINFTAGTATGTGLNGEIGINIAEGDMVFSDTVLEFYHTTGLYSFYDPTGSNYARLDTSLIATSDKTFTFPNASGTFMLTSAIGSTVQAYDADLTTWAGITPATGVATALAVNVGTAGAFVVNGGALGTPSSGTLTNATGLPAASIVAGIIGVTGTRMTKVWTTDIESTNMITINGTSLSSATATFTNKRIQPRTASSTTSANLSPDLSTANVYYRTTQTATLTIDAPIGTPVIGETIMIYVDSAGAQTLTINATYIPFGAAFPATTTAGKTFMMSCQYNGTNWKTLWANAV